MTVTTNPIDLRSLAPMGRSEAAELGRVEYIRFADALAALTPDEWAAETDCTGWTVRDLAGHLAGAVETASTIRKQVAEQREFQKRAKNTGEDEVDAMTAIQIEKSIALDHDDIIDRLRSLAAAAAVGRKRMPAVLAKRITFPVVMNTLDEKWSLDYLLGPILTRDTWLHRVSDLARATGQHPALDAAHDGRIVADVAAEWARRHGTDVQLSLQGVAGGSFTAGTGGPSLALDAIDFCRILSRRAEATHPLLETEVPF
jgi:uncharacterized protein (TIGR03083 family)